MKKKTKSRIKIATTIILIGYVYMMLIWNSGITFSTLITIETTPAGTSHATQSEAIKWLLMLIATSIAFFMMLKLVNELNIKELREGSWLEQRKEKKK